MTTNRYYSIEDARETLSFVNEDLHEADVLNRAGNKTLALNIIEAVIKSVEAAAKEYPEMEAELIPMTAKIAPYIKQVIASK